MFLSGLDDIDRRLVELLIHNARMSYSDLGLEVELVQFSAVVNTLRASDTVTQIYQVSGRNKLHVHAVAAGQGELEDFLDRVIHRLPGVASLSCNIILSRIKDIKGLRL